MATVAENIYISDIVTILHHIPISAPENFVVIPTSSSEIELNWNDIENTMSYNIYRDGSFLTNVTDTIYTDENLEYNTEYCYQISAVNDTKESETTEEICVKTLGESIEEHTISLHLYPNPTNDKISIN